MYEGAGASGTTEAAATPKMTNPTNDWKVKNIHLIFSLKQICVRRLNEQGKNKSNK